MGSCVRGCELGWVQDLKSRLRVYPLRTRGISSFILWLMFCGVRRDQVCQVRNQSSPSSLLSLPTPLPHCVWLYVLIKSIYTIILYYCQPKQLLLLWLEILYVRNSPLEFLPSSLEHCFESSSNTRLVFVQIIWLDSIYFNQLRGSRIPRCSPRKV